MAEIGCTLNLNDKHAGYECTFLRPSPTPTKALQSEGRVGGLSSAKSRNLLRMRNLLHENLFWNALLLSRSAAAYLDYLPLWITEPSACRRRLSWTAARGWNT